MFLLCLLLFLCTILLQLSYLCWKNGFEHNKLAIFELKLQGSHKLFSMGPHENVFSSMRR